LQLTLEAGPAFNPVGDNGTRLHNECARLDNSFVQVHAYVAAVVEVVDAT
jgi:hypothetical protein